jgi:maltose alpha-D-glucosyltransferase/alpha-amylase
MRQLPSDWPQVEGAYRPRNGARTPMQWTTGENLGFSSSTPDKLYLPVDTAKDAPNVMEQEDNPNSLLNRTRKLIALRRTEPALNAYAEFVPLYARDNTYPFVYARAKDKDVVLVILNPSGFKTQAKFEFTHEYQHLELLAGKALSVKKEGTTMDITVPGQSYAIYKLKQ